MHSFYMCIHNTQLTQYMHSLVIFVLLQGDAYCFRYGNCLGELMTSAGFASGTTQEVCCSGGGGSWGGNGDGVCVNCDAGFNTTCNPCFPDEDTTAAIQDAITNGGMNHSTLSTRLHH